MSPGRILALAIALSASGIILAQVSPGQSKTDKDDSRPDQTVTSDTAGNRPAGAEDNIAPQPRYALKPWHALRSHLHNKIIHVPIGFSLSAFLLSLLALRWPELQPAIRWLVLVAALGSLFAIATGINQASAYDGGSKEWLVDIHEALAMTTAVMLWAWSASHWIPALRKGALILGTVVVVLLVAAGFFGGIIAHG